jgi:hypothetical protein
VGIRVVVDGRGTRRSGVSGDGTAGMALAPAGDGGGGGGSPPVPTSPAAG